MVVPVYTEPTHSTPRLVERNVRVDFGVKAQCLYISAQLTARIREYERTDGWMDGWVDSLNSKANQILRNKLFENS